ncbi:MAG: class III extradiol ring-cleavage dioxygenase [Planctomycetota bacterium]
MSVDRREFLRLAAAASAAAAASRQDGHGPPTRTFPVGFVSHGEPGLALDAARGAALAAWGRALDRPRALLVVSAHWERAPLAIGTAATEPLLYDFSGFAEPLCHVKYRAPGAPVLAIDLRRRLGCEHETTRPWDHGVWVPLLHMFPEADVPVLQLSLPTGLAPDQLLEIGRRLQPLRDEGIFILASGGLVHNLARLEWRDPAAPPPAWAQEFEAWVGETLAAWDLDALVDARQRAPAAQLAHPTLEHWLPLLIAVGAAGANPLITYPVQGFELGSLSRRCVQLG